MDGDSEMLRRYANYMCDRHTGQYCRYDIECVRGHAKPSRGQGCKKKNYVRLNCPWLAKLVFSKNVGAWIFTFRHSRHSHDRDQLPAHIPAHRRRHRTGDVEQSLQQLLEQPRATCTDVAEQLQRQNPGLVIHPQDVLNAKAQHRRAAFEGRTPTQQFVHELRTDPDTIVRIQFENDQPDGRIRNVFWTYRWNLNLWRRNFEVLSVDNTYKTSRFNMPFMQISGVTGLHTTYNVAFALLSNENEESYSMGTSTAKCSCK